MYFIRFFTCWFVLAVCVSAAEPCKPWTNLFDRTEIWLGADGIFSIPLDGNDALASADMSTRTLFVFSDTFVGSADPETHRYKDARMINHSAAILTGNEPKNENIRFIYGRDGDMSRSNLFGVNCWLQDGIVIDRSVYLTALRTGKDWKPVGIDLVRIPLTETGEPDWPKFHRIEDFPILVRNETAQVCFGIGILDRDSAEGFVYIYGYRDDLKTHRKSLVAARVEKKSFNDAQAWQFWSGSDWTPDIRSTLDFTASLVDRVSCELSVTPLPDGRFLLVYTRDVMSPIVECRLGDSPVGRFGEPIRIYEAPEPERLGPGIYCYNAKAHPHLSRPGKLLISYNVNRLGGLPHRTDEYRPRFIELDLNRFKKK